MEAIRGCSHLLLGQNIKMIMIGSLRQIVYSKLTPTEVICSIVGDHVKRVCQSWPSLASTQDALQTPYITTSPITAPSPDPLYPPSTHYKLSPKDSKH